MEINAEGLRLVSLLPEDKEEFYQLATESDGSNYWYDKERKEKRSKEEFFRDWNASYFDEADILGGQCFWIVVNQRKVGVVCYNQIDQHNQRSELDILIGHKQDWGQGYGSKALTTLVTYLFNELHLHKVWVEARANNPRAVAAYQKAGFEVEGRFKSHDYFQGEFVDCIRLGCINSN